MSTDAAEDYSCQRQFPARQRPARRGAVRGDHRRVHPRRPRPPARGARSARCSLTPYRIEHRYVHTDGGHVWTRSTALRSATATPSSVSCTSSRTSRPHAPPTRRCGAARNGSQLALDGSGDTLLDWDLRSGELYLSEHSGRMTGGQPSTASRTRARPARARSTPTSARLSNSRSMARCRRTPVPARAVSRARAQRRLALGRDACARDGTRRRRQAFAGHRHCADITDRKHFEARQSEFMADC